MKLNQKFIFSSLLLLLSFFSVSSGVDEVAVISEVQGTISSEEKLQSAHIGVWIGDENRSVEISNYPKRAFLDQISVVPEGLFFSSPRIYPEVISGYYRDLRAEASVKLFPTHFFL